MVVQYDDKTTSSGSAMEMTYLSRSMYTTDSQRKDDDNDMARLGREQVTIRRFKPLALCGFTLGLSAIWPYVLATTPLSLQNGGPAGAIWCNIGMCFAMSTVVISLAHTSSMAPSSGGPYHWVYEFATPKSQQRLSYLVGWFDMISWQVATAGTAYFFGTMFWGLIALCDTSFMIKSWHITVIAIAATIFATVANLLIRHLVFFEAVMCLLILARFVVIVITMLVLGPRENVHDIFFDFQNNAGWGNLGLANLLGVLPAYINISGSDSTCHLAEETPGAARKVPMVMLYAMLFNYTSAIVMVIVVMICSTGYSQTVAEQTGQPGIAILLNATQSRTATIIFTVIMLIIFFFCLVNGITVTSRITWAFARDKGMPFHE